ncbi:MAG: hypothetical protein NZ957_04965 [Thaumarchaeota archaeon]|nr:hypothetical protein [Candidatus Calditenuaceae archaeon]MDW8042127.1 hypothetical protein [Nitrososphaerota archaeon]
MKFIEVRIEELRRMAAALESVLNMKVEPFTVNVSSLLKRLRSIIEESRDFETVVLDAEVLYRVSVVLGLQQKYILQSASSLLVDSQVIVAKVLRSEPHELAAAFMTAWRPLARLEHVTTPLLIRAYEHFLSLPGKLVRPETVTASNERAPGWDVYEALFEEELRSLRSELESETGWVDYWEFISRAGGRSRTNRAYLLSFLITRGEVEVQYDPLKEEIRVKASAPSPSRREGGVLSLVITLGPTGSEVTG